MSNVAIVTLAAILALGAWVSTRDSDQPEASPTPADSGQEGAATTTTADSNPPEAKPIRITRVSFDPPGPDTGRDAHLGREWVAIKSFGQQSRQLSDWTLRDSEGRVFHFPRFELRPDTTVTVHTGDGQRTRHDLYWGKDKYVWGNTGGRATLRAQDGRRIDRCRWGNGDGLKHC
jgi:hypothetical protein